jgi:hypothetical protein
LTVSLSETYVSKLANLLEQHHIDTTTLKELGGVDAEKVCSLEVKGERALDSCDRLRVLAPQTGHWPILLGEDDDLESLHRTWEEDPKRSTAEILHRAEVMAQNPDPSGWWDQRNPESASTKSGAEEDAADAYPHGPWPRGRHSNHHYSIPFDFERQPKRKIHIGLVPTPVCWHVPAHLRYGDWNDCPPAEEHCALMKFWFEKYGAEVVGMTHDVIEMRVGKPPRTRAAALELAKLQCSYSPDIVSQGVETIENLAACLLRGTVWYFWWD